MIESASSPVSQLSSAVGVLSAMITPAILILASGSILATTSARLIRVHDRLRDIAAEIQALVASGKDDELSRERRELLFILLQHSTRRARILQGAMTRLYLAIGGFVLTSLVIGVLSLTRHNIGWVSLAFGFIAAMLLLAASVLLILESRLAVASTRAETDFVWRWGAHHLRGQALPRE